MSSCPCFLTAICITPKSTPKAGCHWRTKSLLGWHWSSARRNVLYYLYTYVFFHIHICPETSYKCYIYVFCHTESCIKSKIRNMPLNEKNTVFYLITKQSTKMIWMHYDDVMKVFMHHFILMALHSQLGYYAVVLQVLLLVVIAVFGDCSVFSIEWQ